MLRTTWEKTFINPYVSPRFAMPAIILLDIRGL